MYFFFYLFPKDPIILSNDDWGVQLPAQQGKFRFHAPILSFGEPGSLGIDEFIYSCRSNFPLSLPFGHRIRRRHRQRLGSHGASLDGEFSTTRRMLGAISYARSQL